MGRELQKRKNRTKVPKLKKKRKLLHNGDKKINVLGNDFIADNWDNNLTLMQNYRHLGLTSRLNAPTGGTEKAKGRNATTQQRVPNDLLYISNGAKSNTKVDFEEVRVERDPETGRIIKVIGDRDNDNDEIEIAGRKRKRSNPLGDPLNNIEQNHVSGNTLTAQSDFIRRLELRAAQEEEAVKKRRPRQQSKREEEWVERLVAKHGENISAMVRDKKLNHMQQSEGDIRRRVRIWKERKAA